MACIPPSTAAAPPMSILYGRRLLQAAPDAAVGPQAPPAKRTVSAGSSPVPTSTHQAVILFLYVHAYLTPRGGVAMARRYAWRIRRQVPRTGPAAASRPFGRPYQVLDRRPSRATISGVDGDSYVEHGSRDRPAVAGDGSTAETTSAGDRSAHPRATDRQGVSGPIRRPDHRQVRRIGQERPLSAPVPSQVAVRSAHAVGSRPPPSVCRCRPRRAVALVCQIASSAAVAPELLAWQRQLRLPRRSRHRRS